VNNDRTWSVRAFREGDETGIYALWQAVRGGEVYGYDAWLRWWRWMFRENPRGPGLIHLAVDGERVAGQYALIPVHLKVGGNRITACLAMNIMTHPDYRRQGIFEALSGTVYQAAEESGRVLFYGFPNRNSRPGVMKLSRYEEVSRLRVMVKALNWKNIIRSRLPLRRPGKSPAGARLAGGMKAVPEPGGVAVIRARSFDDRVDRFWEEVSRRWPCCVVKDRNYLNWRYAVLDDRSRIWIAEKAGEMAGYMVARETVRRGIRMALVFDLAAESEPVLQGLVSEAAVSLRESGVDAMVYQVLTDRRYARILARGGFMTIPFIQGTLPGLCLRQALSGMVKAPLSGKEWFIQLGDSDAMNGYQEA
jgi:GNAT superfamily N-acetyltransferase